MLSTIERELSTVIPTGNTLISVGMFDGMHIGHQALINQLVNRARAQKTPSIVITFKQHPSALLSPQNMAQSIISLDERIKLLKKQEIDYVLALTFSPELAALGAEAFVQLLMRHLLMQGMVLGWDFALGHHREGSLDTLCSLGRRLGFSTEVVAPVKYQSYIVSSTAIRQLLATGDIATANAMLGRPFCLEGKVINGDGRGRELGFPTANLIFDRQQVLPADGVYAAKAILDDCIKPSAVFIGTRPTFGGKERIVEPHILDFERDIYNQKLKLAIIERLREEEKFPDAASLKKQIETDILQVQRLLA
ncbi:MAG: bifunctional riboflavin kinase/FAD synthetase [Dehalococcoidia bacterium]|nr:bifunctional riboflavin kinase/FAD synthetase [Dehalococcoidia bacterium]